MTEAPSAKPGEVWAVVPASGSGSRFSAQQDKLLYEINGIPVLIRTLNALLTIEGLSGVLLVCSQATQEPYATLIQRYIDPSKPIRYAIGGPTRRESVYNGLLALP